MMKLNMEWDNYFYASILLAGLLGYARLKLEAHTFMQVLIGFLVGVFSEAVFLLA
jgi:membrane-associated phospholipid phosphatase